ncbi:MAG: DMT family transporter [Candidatus Odinarchaeota archaeon]
MSSRAFSDRNTGYVFIASIFWGTSFPAISLGLRYASPEQLLFLRFFIASLIAIALYRGSLMKALTVRSLALVGWINGVAYLLQFIGQQWVPAGQTSILVNSFTIITPFFAYFIIGENLTIRKIIAAVIGLIGVFFITNNATSLVGVTSVEYLAGVVIVFISGMIWGIYVTLGKKLQMNNRSSAKNSVSEKKITHSDIFVATLVHTAILSAIGILLLGKPVDKLFLIEPLLAGTYLAIFCTIIPFSLYLRSLDHIDVGLSVIILLIEVIVSFLISNAYLGEIIGINQVFGSLLIISGIIIAITGVNPEMEN